MGNWLSQSVFPVCWSLKKRANVDDMEGFEKKFKLTNEIRVYKFVVYVEGVGKNIFKLTNEIGELKNRSVLTVQWGAYVLNLFERTYQIS